MVPELVVEVVVVVRRVVLVVVVGSEAEVVVEVLLEVVVDRLAEEALEEVVGSGVHLVVVASHREADVEASHREDVAGEVPSSHSQAHVHIQSFMHRGPEASFQCFSKGSLTSGSGQSY